MKLRYAALLIGPIILMSATCLPSFANPAHEPRPAQPVKIASAPRVVTAYFSILNNGMKSRNFSALETIYSSGATLRHSGPDGTTKVYHGLAQILGFYQSLPASLGQSQWTQDSMRRLTTNVVLSYEHAGTPAPPVAGRAPCRVMSCPNADAAGTIVSRSSELFVVNHGLIVSVDWTTFFSRQS
jgi:hypothetical protein